jgi:hypothetical protein
MTTLIKRHSFKKFDFKESDEKHFGFAYIKKLESPFIIDNHIVVGYRTQKIRSNRTGCTLSNHVHTLLFRNINELGVISNWLYESELSSFPIEFKARFWQVFHASGDFFLYDQIQLSVAKDIIDQYDTHAPDSVTHYMNDNKYYWELLYSLKAGRENKRMEARQNILEMQEKWFKDENLSAVFDRAMSQPLPRESAQKDLKQVIQQKEREIRKIDKYLSTASSIESTWIEREDKQKLEYELRVLYNQI